MKLILYSADLSHDLELAFADQGIRAGFPSPAQDCGIDDGDLLVIDKGIEPQDGDIVVAYIDGEFTLKKVRFEKGRNCLWLVPANEEYQPIKVTEENDFIIWGVLVYNIKRQLRR